MASWNNTVDVEHNDFRADGQFSSLDASKLAVTEDPPIKKKISFKGEERVEYNSRGFFIPERIQEEYSEPDSSFCSVEDEELFWPFERRGSERRSQSLSSKSRDLSTIIEDLPKTDQKILKNLALKRRNRILQNQMAEKKRNEWNEEHQNLLQNKINYEIMWSSFLARKRQIEAKQKRLRMLYAKRELEESQMRLKALIREKEERARKTLQNPKRMRSDRYDHWTLAEEKRRKHVEQALLELFERDTQYRKDLSSHLESRIRAGNARRQAIKMRESQYVSETNRQEFEAHEMRLRAIEARQNAQIQSIQKSIQQKDDRITNFMDINNRNRLTETKEILNDKAEFLKRDLDTAMDAWRKRVLEIQSRSISKAEANVKSVLEERKSRYVTESRRRVERQRKNFQEVQAKRVSRREEYKALIEKKNLRIEAHRQRKNEELKMSKKYAKRASELREALTSPDTEGENLDVLITRILSCSLSNYRKWEN